jgi:ubiquinone/menaquinone biosynthesis C-methylase UbiE
MPRSTIVADSVDLYDSHYSNIQQETHREIRREAFGEDLGQTSWITADECRRFAGWLGLTSSSTILEVACGSGGVAVFLARETGCAVVGIDVNRHAIEAATERARREGFDSRVGFRVVDASGSLLFQDTSFDAVFCNDSINHLPDRLAVLGEWHRVLRPAGALLYTDPIVVTGILTNEEIALRSSIGFFLFTPLGENERLLTRAGFEVLRAEDTTASVVLTSERWRDAREKRRKTLLQIEKPAEFDGMQRFLAAVHKLSYERRLSRFAYLARKRA